MIKIIYTKLLDQSKQESLFADQGELQVHQSQYPEMYDGVNYTFEQFDITEELEAQKDVDKYLARIKFGQVLMAELASKNKLALEAGTLTTEQVIALKQALAPVKDFLTEGSLGYALGALQQAQVDESLKAYFVAKMQGYLSAE